MCRESGRQRAYNFVLGRISRSRFAGVSRFPLSTPHLRLRPVRAGKAAGNSFSHDPQRGFMTRLGIGGRKQRADEKTKRLRAVVVVMRFGAPHGNYHGAKTL